MPYSWVPEALDLTQMVMDVWKALKLTIFIIPINFCFNNIAKKSFPGTPRGHALLLAVRGSGPHPDVHGLFLPILGWSVDQELSFDTLTLSLLSKLRDFHVFLFFTYSNYNIDTQRCWRRTSGTWRVLASSRTVRVARQLARVSKSKMMMILNVPPDLERMRKAYYHLLYLCDFNHVYF